MTCHQIPQRNRPVTFPFSNSGKRLVCYDEKNSLNFYKCLYSVKIDSAQSLREFLIHLQILEIHKSQSPSEHYCITLSDCILSVKSNYPLFD